MTSLRMLSATCLASLTAPLFAADINVPADYATIQAAIAASSNGDAICVAPGAYTENIDFLGKAITIRTAANGDVVTLTGASTAVSTVTFASGEGTDSVLDGLRLIGHVAPSGGAIFIDNANPTITNCLLQNNTAVRTMMMGGSGGAVYISNSTDVTFDNCTFFDNGAEAFGGSLFMTGSSATFDDCLFELGFADRSGGAVRLEDESTAHFARTRFFDNRTFEDGGAVSAFDASVATFKSCEIVQNEGGSGGGVHANDDTSVEFTGCTVADNDASSNGGGLYANNAPNVDIRNTIFWGNTATTGTQGYVIANSSASVLDVSYSTLQDGITGFIAFGTMLTINIGLGIKGLDPLFLDPANGDYHLRTFSSGGAISPCINAGDPADTPADCELDIDREPRVFVVVDQGADERGPLGVTPHRLGIAGGTVTFDLFAPTNANQSYMILGSISGTKNGFVIDGVNVPLNIDAYTTLTLSGTVGSNFFGTLDPSGQFPVAPTLTLPGNPAQPTIGPQLIGLQLDHAVVTLSGTTVVSASNVASFMIDPF